MAKVTLTFEDVYGQVGMAIDLVEPFNRDSNAHKTANMVLNWLDKIHQAIETSERMEPQDMEPRIIKTAAEIDAIKGATLAHPADRRIVLAG